MGFPREAAEWEEGAQNITKEQQQEKAGSPERTREKGGKGKTFTVALGHSVSAIRDRSSYFSKKSRKMI